MILYSVQTLSTQPERNAFFAIFADGASLAIFIVIADFRKIHDRKNTLPFMRMLVFQFAGLDRHS